MNDTATCPLFHGVEGGAFELLLEDGDNARRICAACNGCDPGDRARDWLVVVGRALAGGEEQARWLRP